MKTKTIQVKDLSRVEGEGALFIKMKGDEVLDVKFKIVEPPRFFEAFLCGRTYDEVHDITSRICGICPAAHQVTSVQAVERAFGYKISGQLRNLRRLLYCGQMIESHALHVFMLHAPDFLGYPSAIHMAKDYPDIVKAGLELKKLGNDIMTLMGGREIHPVNVRVGGFYKLPSKQKMIELGERIKPAIDAACKAVQWVSKLEFPEFEQHYDFVSLRHPDEYPFNDGSVCSSNGLDITSDKYEKYFTEEHVEHTTALHSFINNNHGIYSVGPSARFALNHSKLSKRAKDAAKSFDKEAIVKNPYMSIIIRSIETVCALEDALTIIENYEMPDRPAEKVSPKAATGCFCTEAPRGLLFHTFTMDKNGVVTKAKIVTPTAQNQKIIENDLLNFVRQNISMPEEELQWKCEQAIRNYDPCISCSAHFLNLKLQRD